MRLIDADELVAQMEADAEHMDGITAKMLAYAAISDVNHAPTVDALQVIRCKYCKHWIDHRCRKVRSLDDWRKCDDYCSFAEGKEE